MVTRLPQIGIVYSRSVKHFWFGCLIYIILDRSECGPRTNVITIELQTRCFTCQASTSSKSRHESREGKKKAVFALFRLQMHYANLQEFPIKKKKRTSQISESRHKQGEGKTSGVFTHAFADMLAAYVFATKVHHPKKIFFFNRIRFVMFHITSKLHE